jgi:putative oxidoreductase
MANFTDWFDQHHPRWIDYLRIVVGFLLFLKGFLFIQDTSTLQEMMDNSRLQFMSFILAHYVASAHLVGGILIMIGLFTRVAAAFQIPVLIGAIVFVNAEQGFFANGSELSFSILILFLLVFYFFYGSGTLSVKNALNKNKE